MVSAVILAGGRGRRFGKFKPMQILLGKPMVEWVIERMREFADEIVVSVSEPIEIGERICVDVVGDGPLAGIYSSMREVDGEYVAVAPCDTPLISPQLYKLMISKVEGDGIVPVIRGYYEPLHAVYRRDIMLEAAERCLRTGRRKVTDTYEFMCIQTLDEVEVREVDPQLASFMNVNTEDDLIKLERLIRERE